MMAQRLLVAALVAIQATALAILSGTMVFPLSVSFAALFGALATIRIRLTSAQAIRFSIWLGVLLLVKHVLAPFEPPLSQAFAGTAVAFVLAQYLMVMQTAQLFLKRDGDRLPIALPGLSVLAMVCVADIRVSDAQRDLFALLCMLMIVGVALFFRTAQRRMVPFGRRVVGLKVLLAAVLVLSGSLGWAASSALFHYERDLERLIARMLQPGHRRSEIGFSQHAHLDSIVRIQAHQPSQVALRIISSTRPTYLRGMAFDHFTGRHWLSERRRQALHPTAIPEGLEIPRTGENLFALDADAGDEWKMLDIHPEPPFSEPFFLPPGTSRVATIATRVSLDSAGIAEPIDGLRGEPYAAYVPRNPPVPQPLSENDRRRLTALPKRVDPGVVRLAQRLFAHCRGSAERIDAVVRYFHSNYRYALGIRVPPDRDPLTYFLLERPAAHCEYFASGAALLLRLGGVPCRYVTGFHVSGRNRFGGYWVARHRDAHAWVEAWDDQRGWVVVEATPSAALDRGPAVSAAGELWDYLRQRVHQWRIYLRRADWPRFSAQGVWWLVSRPLLWTAIALLLGLYAVRRRRKRGFGRDADPVRIGRLQRLLTRMDAFLARNRLQRHCGETLHQFADRLSHAALATPFVQEAANWYRQYALVRYRGSVEADELRELEMKLETMLSTSPRAFLLRRTPVDADRG